MTYRTPLDAHLATHVTKAIVEYRLVGDSPGADAAFADQVTFGELVTGRRR